MNLPEKWFVFDYYGVVGKYIISLFFQKRSPCNCVGMEYNKVIKAFVCLGHLTSSSMPLEAGKVGELEFAMGVPI